MELTITFESSVPRRTVALHAWEPQGKVWDITQRGAERRHFAFQLEGPVADQRNVQFKFRFPDEHRWESDETTRTIPTRRVHQFWAFDYSPRVTLYQPSKDAAPNEIAVQLITHARFAGGQLYAWQPGTSQHAWIRQATRDNTTDLSGFRVAVAPWMKNGFHFKFVEPGGAFEAESCNRVWRPADGPAISVKSGQATLWVGSPKAKNVSIALLYPKQTGSAPALRLVDQSGDFFEQNITARSAPVPSSEDSRFLKAVYALPIYPEATYTLSLSDPSIEGNIARPLRFAPEDEGVALEKLAVVGDSRWLVRVPPRAPVSLVFHPRPWTPKLTQLWFDVAIGEGAAFERAAARRTPDGSWRAEMNAPVGVSLRATPTADQPLDRRPDGPVSTSRRFTLDNVAPLELHTVDAQTGFVTRPGTAPSAVPGGLTP